MRFAPLLAEPIAVLLVLVVGFTACSAQPSGSVSPVPTAPRAASCSSACANLERLGCPEAKPTKGGLSCVTICERASQIQDMRLSCVTAAPSFTALRACETVRCTE